MGIEGASSGSPAPVQTREQARGETTTRTLLLPMGFGGDPEGRAVEMPGRGVPQHGEESDSCKVTSAAEERKPGKVYVNDLNSVSSLQERLLLWQPRSFLKLAVYTLTRKGTPGAHDDRDAELLNNLMYTGTLEKPERVFDDLQ
ncbi:hypothetical protein E5288_WYG018557 [Bos mutus]|uniref:Uncharacterized protein n=1 Tax=Bos mutus TaxID=72004 RepID=A0A6B0S7F6_9CETA|nr:hypothetical protein [Bos mutus]